MPLIYITGAPGTGKSTLERELSARGYDAYNLDDPRFGGPYNIASSEPVTIPPASRRDADWFDRHEWRIRRDAFVELRRSSGDRTAIVCGVAEQDAGVIDLFDSVIYLSVTDDTLRERLATRVGNDYGKNANETSLIMKRKRALDERYADGTAILIDANGTIGDTMGSIVEYIRQPGF